MAPALHLALALGLALALLLLEEAVDVGLGNAGVFEDAGEKREEVECDAELAPELVEEGGLSRHRHHEVEIEKDQGAKYDQN